MLRNFVLETANAPGTATTVTLAGAPSGRLTFASQFTTGSLAYYFIDDGTQSEWGYGTFTAGTPNQFSRSTVIGNSAGSTARLNFTGSARVYCALPAERSLWIDNTGKLIFGDGTDRFASSATNPGYEKSASGIITQWGDVVVTISGGSTTFSFSIPFPNQAFMCLVQNGDSSINFPCYGASGTLPNKNGMGITTPGYSSGPYRVHYLAKGF